MRFISGSLAGWGCQPTIPNTPVDGNQAGYRLLWLPHQFATVMLNRGVLVVVLDPPCRELRRGKYWPAREVNAQEHANRTRFPIDRAQRVRVDHGQ